MDTAAALYYWARFGIVVLATVLAVVLLVRRSRPRAAKRDLLFGIAGLVGVAVAVFVGAGVDYVLTAAMLAVGGAVGFLTAGTRWIGASLTAIAYVFAVIMLLFGEPKAVAFGVSVLAFGVAVPLGMGLRSPRADTPTAAAPAASEG